MTIIIPNNLVILSRKDNTKGFANKLGGEWEGT